MTKSAFYAVLVEQPKYGLVLHETLPEGGGYEAAVSRAQGAARGERTCVVRCTFETGNELLFDQMAEAVERRERERQNQEEAR